jgi:hypothetical protein
VQLEGLGKLKKIIHIIGSGIRDLPACAAPLVWLHSESSRRLVRLPGWPMGPEQDLSLRRQTETEKENWGREE